MKNSGPQPTLATSAQQPPSGKHRYTTFSSLQKFLLDSNDLEYLVTWEVLHLVLAYRKLFFFFFFSVIL